MSERTEQIHDVRLHVNGSVHEVRVPARRLLSDALRHDCGLPDTDVPVTEEEIEFVWTLHGGIFYLAMRQHVYKSSVQVDFMSHVAVAVDNFLAGAKVTYPRLLASCAPDALGNSASRRTASHCSASLPTSWSTISNGKAISSRGRG